ncbi:hypothetical protein GGI20_005005 [Coemansia sp. BCRC 34301]|nr:hypothetical protein GGI20_005005 [Coemansia sp. BCRC 34301]
MAGLSALRQIGTFRVPQPIGAGLTRDGAFLVTEYIQLEPLRDERKLGRQLAAMHMVRGPQMFGFDMDNYIGTTPQPNSWTKSWVAFLHMRLKFQFDQAPFADETRNQAEELLANLPTIFHDMADMVPSMIHGDMWFNNCATDEHGDSVVFDPAVYWGHHESELGSMKMFGGFGDELYEAYHECIPKAPGFDKRVQLYELYHLVNHLNMFGVAYLHCCTRLIESIHAQLSAN